MVEKKGKRSFIYISSSSSSDEEEEDQVEEADDDEARSLSNFSGDDGDWSEEDANGSDADVGNEDGDDDDDFERDNDNEESLCYKVICLLKEGSDLEDLNLKECKAYLRNHGLRIAGTKAVCVQRIIEHWRIKDGNGEAFYPRTSFVINCTGDVCKGDVVLFTQKVYKKFDKVTRHGGLLGKRTIAGRVAKESYGAAKQQHTFTVEVLWSKGIKKLSPLFPLLVKGRNLYKLNTFRQRWNNEAERLKVLAEKHKRGTAARLVRAIEKTRKTWSANGGVKRQKHCHMNPYQMRKTTEPEQKKHPDLHGKASSKRCAISNNHHQVASQPRHVNMKQNKTSGAFNSSRRHIKPAHFFRDVGATLHSYVDTLQNPYGSQIQFNHRTRPFYEVGTTSSMTRLPSFNPRADKFFMPVSHYQGWDHSNYTHHHAYSNSSYSYEARNLNHFPYLSNVYRPLR